MNTINQILALESISLDTGYIERVGVNETSPNYTARRIALDLQRPARLLYLESFSTLTHQDSCRSPEDFISLFELERMVLRANAYSLVISKGDRTHDDLVVNTPEILIMPDNSGISKETYLDKALIFASQYGSNYFHAVIEECARAEIYGANMNDSSHNMTLVFDGPRYKWHEDIVNTIISMYFPRARSCFVSDCSGALHLQSCVTLPLRTTLLTSMTYSRRFWRKAICEVKISGIENITPGHTVYVPRGKTSKRSIINEEELIGALIGIGVFILDSSRMRPIEQILVCSMHRHLIGFHGAGFANAILMKRNSILTEITCEHLTSDLYPMLCAINKMRHMFKLISRPEAQKDSQVLLTKQEIADILSHVQSCK